ncbi:hypothetical protein A2966_01945 [Candidatus Roizmanbacteria bacterium RIFCSPLOWO2_01_FULL_41_22]|uniref:Glycosyltransferase 2-like domain-containing protein n=1 Tax=Candidatus Roizmanbacteria bacterium RIFCSPLOWO2_01_FULL_41_22 TaxID=1802067 RepID=A0A1F7J9Y5_9BACT|nr:MAG: hypothetical protein A2966_01945 [Candidatus Roizmanbacteria bacterium RIFCSPLOWO2_01_FULL_41_22]
MHTSRPTVSVIIPTRKINRYLLEETLPALQKQSFRRFEVIILPDFILNRYDSLIKIYPWLKILTIKDKSKPGSKRDFGAVNASGQFLAFIDDDVFPTSNWLKNAVKLFKERPTIDLIGGPGILPKKTNTWEIIFDEILKRPLGSGEYNYRFTKKPERLVDDYPAMNLLIRKNTFFKLGGFHTQYWPGEDSKLTNRAANLAKKLVLYHPEVTVYHHRRTSLHSHLTQHSNYGLTRGAFFAQGDKNSTKLMYLIPAFFTLYLVGLSVLWGMSMVFTPNLTILIICLLPIFLYLLACLYLAIQVFVKRKNPVVAVAAVFVLFLTHIVYGVNFVQGFIGELIKR